MTTMTKPMLNEFREEVLDRVPADKLSWKPHAKSMSLGQLAVHIATVPEPWHGSRSRRRLMYHRETSDLKISPPPSANRCHPIVADALAQRAKGAQSLAERGVVSRRRKAWEVLFRHLGGSRDLICM